MSWRRESAAVPGLQKRGRGFGLKQDGSTHEWAAGHEWDLIVTMDDATSENYSMFMCDEEGTNSSLRSCRAYCPLRSEIVRTLLHQFAALLK